MKIALGQINPTVGDFSGNAQKIVEYSRKALGSGAGLIVFPEMSVCGYPARDWIEKPDFVTRSGETAQRIALETREIAVICGFPTYADSETGKTILNSAALLREGKIEFVQSKMLLPTYDVFDEARNFAPAGEQRLLRFCGRQIALTICEDAWNDKQFWNRQLYGVDPVQLLMRAGGNFVVNIAASPFRLGTRELRRTMLQAIAREYRAPVLMVNQIGGNDELIFDGSSLVIGPDGSVIAQAKSFEEDMVFFDSTTLSGDLHEQLEGVEASAHAALVLGTRDFVRKCGFQSVIIGLSGGIDSSLTAAIAAEALGSENVIGVGMPSPYSSRGSIDDSRDLATNLGIRFELLRINSIFDAYRQVLKTLFNGCPEDITEENVQSRIRGNLLMALSNKFGALVLATGNKSELGMGYCTLYGDMVGALDVLADVPKTMVYGLAQYVNSRRPVIPKSTLEKPPSAELRPNQKDSDELPPYEIVDVILEEYIEDNKSAAEIAREYDFDLKLVKKIITMVERSEFKRQQAAPSLKISEKAFGMGRRFPIAAKIQI